MKGIYLLTVLLLMATQTGFAQAKKNTSISPAGNPDEAEVRARMATQEARWSAGDIPGFMAYYWKSDSLKFIGSKGITYGWQKTLDNYLKGYPDKAAMGILTFEVLECTQLSPTAIYVIGKWNLKKDTSASPLTGKPSGGHFTLLWRKIKGEWVIVADHTS